MMPMMPMMPMMGGQGGGGTGAPASKPRATRDTQSIFSPHIADNFEQEDWEKYLTKASRPHPEVPEPPDNRYTQRS